MFTATFERAYETKRTVRYNETENARPKVGAIYVQKSAFDGRSPPPRIRVTIESGEE